MISSECVQFTGSSGCRNNTCYDNHFTSRVNPPFGPALQPPAAAGQPSNIKRTPLQKFDVPGTNYETVIGMAEIVPNVNIGRHTHFGPESGYMLEGAMVLMVEGQPEKTINTGDSYQIPPGAVHKLHNPGTEPLVLLCCCAPAYSHEDTVLTGG